MQKWEQKSSELVFEAGFMKLRKNKCVNPRNSHVGDYYVFHFPDWVTIVPFTQQGNVVMIRQYRHGSQEYELELPGGAIEKGEDVVEAGIRELQEESGGTCSDYELLGKVRPNPSMQDNWCYTVLAKDVQLGSVRNMDLGEDIEVLEMTPRELKQAIKSGELNNAMMISSLYLADAL
ncbi:NUDIX hydrolase [Lentisphaera profundi]|uniref:GDP-mannose pyrophosphatase n=1 Tax=Lentisphaera profundi TaxID=1658616 RepID=A0ABY7VU86_9BACT|nr:NUDIX hydrolase [Lentisphaera profundi]WDE97622.1 NUDIX hydrolase [Lentisphaera profundi]